MAQYVSLITCFSVGWFVNYLLPPLLKIVFRLYINHLEDFLLVCADIDSLQVEV